ncbi:MAG TPA: radical SAM protein [bacterium]|nr:radical SAM protein [bacterium]
MNEYNSENKKYWVRLTRVCNNNCVFCLDADEQDGSFEMTESILALLRAGRARGFDHAVLSGGEPSLHPDFFAIVSETKKMGYKRTQTITNGRMFSYAGFAERAVAAGLDEATFSLHSGSPADFEALTRTPGSYDEALKGFMRAAKLSGLAVSVDILLTARTIPGLTGWINELSSLGASEFDILYPIPFGEAWKHKNEVFFNLDERAKDIVEAFEFCEERGFKAWSNRIPARVFEGAERFIQSPLKLRIEVEAKRDMFEALANRGEEPPCRGERCALCHVAEFCRSLRQFSAAIASKKMPSLLVTQGNIERLDENLPGSPKTIVIDGFDLLKSENVKRRLSKREIQVEALIDKPLENRQGVPDFVSAVYLEINKATASDLSHLKSPFLDKVELKTVLRGRATLEEAAKKDVPIAGFMQEFLKGGGAEIEIFNVPRCLTGRAEMRVFEAVPANVFNNNGEIDLDEYVGSYMANWMSVKSARCAGCSHYADCPGIHINHVRAFGFSNIPFGI